MRNILKYIVFTIVLFVFSWGEVCAFPFQYRAGNPLKDDKDVKTGAIPSEYSFSLGKGPTNETYNVPYNVKVFNKRIGELQDKGFVWVNNNTVNATDANKSKIKNDYFVKATNVGMYNGKKIDVVASVVDYATINEGWNEIDDHLIRVRANKLGVDVANIKYVTILFTFYESNTNTKIRIKGNTTYWDVDAYQGINAEDSSLRDIYVSEKFKGQIQLKKDLYYIYNDKIGNLGLEGLIPGFYWQDCDSSIDKFTNPKHCTGAFAYTETFEGESIKRTFTFGYPHRDGWGRPSGGGITLDPVAVVEVPKYGYSMDMACSYCEADNAFDIKDNKAFVFQDTFDWTAIKASDSINSPTSTDACTNLKKHFKQKNPDIYCREEYYVYLPNKNDADKMVVEKGRYFTLNEFSKVSDIQNFKPVEVKKIRECKHKDDNMAALKSYGDNNSLVGTDTGEIYVDYQDDSKVYVFSNKILQKKLEEDSYKSLIDGNTLRQEIMYSYTLPSDFYRYSLISSGLVKEKINNDEIASGKYVDLGVSTLPISNESKKLSITFKYKLPERMQVYGSDNKGLNCMSTAESNIYKTIKKEAYGQTACYKLYSADVHRNNCVDARKNNNVACAIDESFILTRKENNGKVPYTCNFSNNDSDGNPKCNEDTYTKMGRAWNEKDEKCCDFGEKYYSEFERCAPDSDGGACKEENGKNYLYYDGKYEEVDKKTYDELCCPDEKYKCPDGTCVVTREKCDIPSGSFDDVIYRTIDLNNPFVGQAGLPRNTGSNWGFYDSIKKSFDFTSDNLRINDILNKDVYSKDNALYHITLDSEKIKKIREYNKNTDYDDWNFTGSNGAYFSEFLDKFEVDGKCTSNLKDNYSSCIQRGDG